MQQPEISIHPLIGRLLFFSHHWTPLLLFDELIISLFIMYVKDHSIDGYSIETPPTEVP